MYEQSDSFTRTTESQHDLSYPEILDDLKNAALKAADTVAAGINAVATEVKKVGLPIVGIVERLANTVEPDEAQLAKNREAVEKKIAAAKEVAEKRLPEALEALEKGDLVKLAKINQELQKSHGWYTAYIFGGVINEKSGYKISVHCWNTGDVDIELPSRNGEMRHLTISPDGKMSARATRIVSVRGCLAETESRALDAKDAYKEACDMIKKAFEKKH